MFSERQQEIGDYIVGRTLGSGTTGKVKLATKKGTSQQYAIKIIKKSAFETKPQLQMKIRREVALMRLLQHPHLLKLEEFAESPRHLYIVLEYAQNGELFDYLIERRCLPLDHGMHFFQEMVYAIEYLHNHAICHRDLKPENILLDQNNHIKIADFGFARWMRADIAETSCGSPHYAAPEVIKGLPYDGRCADVWSLGVILYALLVGRLPFDDPSVRNLLNKVKQGRFKMPDLPEPIQELISRMLTVDSKERIKISEIKETRAFRLFSPKDYVFPKPLPIPFITEPINPSSVPPATFSVLRCIGYSSDKEITDELNAPIHTMAKVFAYMLSHNTAIDALSWPTGTNEAIPEDAFLVSPDTTTMGSLRTDSFGRRKIVPSVSSLETFSLAETQFAGIDFNTESTPDYEEDNQYFEQICVPLDHIMCALQKCLTENACYEYLHPDDFHIFARNAAENSYVVFEAEYQDEEQIKLTMIPLKIEKQQFDILVGEVQACIEEAIEEFTNPSFENEESIDF